MASSGQAGMSRRFVGRSVLVTGAGLGIGRAAALLFAKEGGRLVVVDQNEADAQATVSLIHDAGGEAFAVRADVSREADCRAMVERALDAYGRLHVAFNNAGVGASGFGREGVRYAMEELSQWKFTGIRLNT